MHRTHIVRSKCLLFAIYDPYLLRIYFGVQLRNLSLRSTFSNTWIHPDPEMMNQSNDGDRSILPDHLGPWHVKHKLDVAWEEAALK